MSILRTPLGKPVGQTVLLDYDGASTRIKYVGWAVPGTTTSQSLWLIARLTYDVSNRLTAVEWSNARIEYNVAWDDRATTSYS